MMPHLYERKLALSRAAPLVIGLLIAVAAGCSGAGSSPESEKLEGPELEAANAYLQLPLSGGDWKGAAWEMTSSELQESCERLLLERSLEQFWTRVRIDQAKFAEITGEGGRFVRLDSGPGWVLAEEPDIELKLALVQENGEWRAHPDLSSTYCTDAPPLPSIVDKETSPSG